MVGQKFVYAHVDRDIKSREIKGALELLETAGVVIRVRQTGGSGLPLSASVHESIFKVLFLDVGLFHAVSGNYSETTRKQDFNAIFKGAVTEQFAGQEILANQSPYTKTELFYWGRKAKSSTAEIDYLIEKYGCIKALKISQAHFVNGNPIISLPFFAIESFLKKK